MKPHSRPVRTFAISATSFLFTLAATLLVLTALAAGTGTPGNTAAASKKTDKKTMRAFASEEELKAYFRKLAEERKQAARRNRVPGGLNSRAIFAAADQLEFIGRDNVKNLSAVENLIRMGRRPQNRSNLSREKIWVFER